MIKSYYCVKSALIGLATIPLLVGFYPMPISPDVEIIEPEPPPAIVEQIEIPNKKHLGEFQITAYCPCEKCCGPWADGIVYTGGYATENQTIAVDPDVIPLGSTVEINGQQYIAEDIGGAIQNKRIDVFFTSHDAALVYGIQNHDVYLIE